ncbi:hypothetical protein LXL04_018294 [Taraxacum kok-saghyz]
MKTRTREQTWSLDQFKWHFCNSETTGPPPAPTGPPPAHTTGPPSDHRRCTTCTHHRTTAGPPSDHRLCTHHRTTIGAPPAPTTGPPSVHHLHPPPDHRRTTVGPPAVHPPPDHRRCTTCTHHRTNGGPPSVHHLHPSAHWTTDAPPPYHRRTTTVSEIRMTLIYDADAEADEEMLTLMSTSSPVFRVNQAHQRTVVFSRIPAGSIDGRREAEMGEKRHKLEILEKQVSKVEHLFSTCTQKVKYRKSRYETLEKDQRFWLKREERDLANLERPRAPNTGA